MMLGPTRYHYFNQLNKMNMKKQIFTFLFTLCVCGFLSAQVYLDEFDNDIEEFTYISNGYTTSEADGEWTIQGDGTGGPFEVFGYQPFDSDGNAITLDVTGNNKIYVRAKASNLGTSLRMDLKDNNGFVTSLDSKTNFLIADYQVYEFDFTGGYMDGGFGSPCTDAPCMVDGTQVAAFEFFVNPGQGAFAGTVVIDFLAVGSAPSVGPMSDIFQDQFDDPERSLLFVDQAGANPGMGVFNVIEDGLWKIRGDGTAGPWDPVNILAHNPATLDTVDVSVADGNDKVYIRARTDVDGTAIRLDLMDINEFASTLASATTPITDEWVTYEFNFAGLYQDLGYGGTGCGEEAAPCLMDPERIANFIVFVNPGNPEFLGEVQIDYISVGTSLEAGANDPLVLVYGDHFSEDRGNVSTTASYGISIDESLLSINGSGADSPYSSIAYSILDDEGAGTSIDVTENNKMFARVRCDVSNTILRVDLVDTTGYVTNAMAQSRLINTDGSGDFEMVELNFLGSYLDGGFGGPCEDMDNGCIVDPTAIQTVLFYPNPDDGGFAGNIDIDYVSFGAPMGEDTGDAPVRWDDHFDDENRDNWTDGTGFTITESGTELTIVGDGSATPYTAFEVTPLDSDGNPLVLNMNTHNNMYFKVKSTVEGTPIRVDLKDAEGYVTTEEVRIGFANNEYSVINLNYDSELAYVDHGWGGTACEAGTGPCPVDGSQIVSFVIFIDPDNGGFEGEVTLDWMSVVEPLEDVEDPDTTPLGQDDYADEFDSNNIDFFNAQDGFALSAADGIVTAAGDGTSGAYAPIGYALNDGTDTLTVNAANNSDKVFIHARSTVDVPLRIDLVDNKNFNTTLAGASNMVTPEWTILEYSYTGGYSDGGFGGTACEVGTGPCPVDAQRIESIQLYFAEGVGLYEGTFDLDWVSFGEPLMVNVVDNALITGGRIFPNPAQEEVHIELQTLTTGTLTATITDIAGRMVQIDNLGQANGSTTVNTINVSNLTNGLYILNVAIDGKPAFNNKLVIR